ncbi:hypothetical protein GCM10010361_45140 [Streptomyces olivaceiscleroticus]|uniref:Phosphate acetyl/butaryl transferase domain-containing protein n=1 Tax=Streptomyces olivaceiscleroticus TaxID=68245 RepID=A0ABN1AG64_9ACTN
MALQAAMCSVQVRVLALPGAVAQGSTKLLKHAGNPCVLGSDLHRTDIAVRVAVSASLCASWA